MSDTTTVQSMEWGTSQNGHPQLRLTFRNNAFWIGYFSDAAAKYAIETLRICGWKGDDLSTLSASDLTNTVTTVESQDGKTRVRPVNKPMDVKALSARMRGLCAAIQPNEDDDFPNF